MVHEPHLAPAFVLVENGYDVWLGNNRGSVDSHAHVSLDIHSAEYWNFYQEEMARYDVPAFLDYIIDYTGVQNVTYIGHSEGTTQFFMGASILPDYYAERVNLSILMAPVANTHYLPAWYFRAMADNYDDVKESLETAHLYNFMPPSPDTDIMMEFLCGLPYLHDYCAKGLNWIHHDLDDDKAFATSLSYVPAGSGYRNILYYLQMMNSGRYAFYDYGEEENMLMYGQKEPKLIPIEDYRVPTALLCGDMDELADDKDVEWIHD